MIDYIHVNAIKLGPVSLQPFGLLVALGVAVGMKVATARGQRLGLPAAELSSFIGWMLVAGFIGRLREMARPMLERGDYPCTRSF